MTDPSRNSLCPCGSGAKYKHCCLKKPGSDGTRKETNKIRRKALGITLVASVVGVSGGYYWGWETAAQISVCGVLLGLSYLIFAKPPKADRSRSSGGNIDFGR